jgi:hypothetical protein
LSSQHGNLFLPLHSCFVRWFCSPPQSAASHRPVGSFVHPELETCLCGDLERLAGEGISAQARLALDLYQLAQAGNGELWYSPDKMDTPSAAAWMLV